MQLDDVTISRAITESFMKDFQKAMDVEVAIEVLQQLEVSQ